MTIHNKSVGTVGCSIVLLRIARTGPAPSRLQRRPSQLARPTRRSRN